MSDVIFAKSNYERKPQFQICTQIIKKESGEKYVLKKALSERAIEHIESLYKKESMLAAVVGGRISIVKPVREKIGVIRFPFLAGKKLSEVVNEEIEACHLDRAYSLIEDFCTEMKKMATATANNTKEYCEIFGNHSLPGELHYIQPANIDLIFDNIIYDENKGYQLLDYEWCFDFAVPVEYIIYRSILLLPAMGKLNEKESNYVWNITGISVEMKELFYRMEESFQKYVYSYERKLETVLKMLPVKQSKLDEILNFAASEKEYESAYKESSKQMSEYVEAYHTEATARYQYEEEAKKYLEAYKAETNNRLQVENQAKKYLEAYQLEEKQRIQVEQRCIVANEEVNKLRLELKHEKEKYIHMSWGEIIKHVRHLKNGEKR